MTAPELRRRIAQGENLHTECKGALLHADALAATLVAFANTDGGQLLIGVADDGRIQGVPEPDHTCREVDNVARNNCQPPVTVVQEVVRTKVGRVVVVNVPKGDQRPYHTNRGICYIRTTSGRRQASREELLRLFQATESLYYDETPLIRLTLRDLDLEAFRSYLEETGQGRLTPEARRILRSWRLLSGEHPTVAGLLLFGRHPQEHLPYAQIHAARIPGVDLANDPLDRKDFGGRLLEVIDQAMRFLRLHLPVPHRIRGLEPEPRPELPEEALREALVNSVAHRDYTVRGPIRLFIFDDRIEFRSPGKVPNTVDLDAMQAGIHIVRNPHIYARLSDAGLVTRAGSGIPRMLQLVRQATRRPVQIVLREWEVLVSIPRKKPAKR
jgi:ATP-dependent DNA helicase RecG